VLRVQRCEDGAWDPREKHANDFYFRDDGEPDQQLPALAPALRRHRASRAGRHDPDSAEGRRGPQHAGQRDDRSLGPHSHGRGSGQCTRVSKIWLYSIGTGQLIQVAAHNPRFFDPTVPNNSDLITQDEESSGIIDASHILERGWFLVDVQAHKLSTDPELVEGGQLLALFVDPRIGQSKDGDEDDDSGHGGEGRR